jgi:hypothetical protein
MRAKVDDYFTRKINFVFGYRFSFLVIRNPLLKNDRS